MAADNIRELPVGKYDAVRLLRHSLQLAEKGEINRCIIICADADAEGGGDIWAVWSEMTRHQVLWYQRWFNSWLNKRYFGNYHEDDDEE